MRLGCVPSRLLGRNSSGADQNSRHDHAEDESADMGEERDATATGLPVHQGVVALEELVEEPAAEVEPRRDPDREPQHQREDA
jgi:hypothetical protein